MTAQERERREQQRRASRPVYCPGTQAVILGKKVCTGCGRWLSEYCFQRRARTHSGLEHRCNECRAAYLQRVKDGKRIPGGYGPRGDKLAPEEYRRRQQEGNKRWRKTSAKGRAGKKAQQKRRLARGKAELRDSYVRALLKDSTGVPAMLIPQELVEAKRAHIKAVRLIKERTT